MVSDRCPVGKDCHDFRKQKQRQQPRQPPCYTVLHTQRFTARPATSFVLGRRRRCPDEDRTPHLIRRDVHRLSNLHRATWAAVTGREIVSAVECGRSLAIRPASACPTGKRLADAGDPVASTG